MARRFAISLLCAASLLSGCATTTTQLGSVDKGLVNQEEAEQRRLILEQAKTDADRVYRIVAPVMRAATDICAPDKVGATFGLFDIDTLENVPKEFRNAARVEQGLSDGLTFVFVEAESPLGKAGIATGDVLVGMNGKTFTKKTKGLREFREEYEKLALIPTPLVIAHNGEQRTVTIAPERLPRLAVHYDAFDGVVNAFADGQSLHVLRGLLRAMSSDDAIAMVVAHEIAHNCQLHLEAQKTNRNIGLAIDVLAALGGVSTGGQFAQMGREAYSQDFEREADYVGLYYLARAGRPLDESIKMYRLLSVEGGSGSLKAAYSSSHPSTRSVMSVCKQLRPKSKEKSNAVNLWCRKRKNSRGDIHPVRRSR